MLVTAICSAQQRKRALQKALPPRQKYFKNYISKYAFVMLTYAFLRAMVKNLFKAQRAVSIY